MFKVTQTYKMMTSVIKGVAVSPAQEIDGHNHFYVKTLEEAKRQAYQWLQQQISTVEIVEYEQTKKWEIELDVLKMKEIA